MNCLVQTIRPIAMISLVDPSFQIGWEAQIKVHQLHHEIRELQSQSRHVIISCLGDLEKRCARSKLNKFMQSQMQRKRSSYIIEIQILWIYSKVIARRKTKTMRRSLQSLNLYVTKIQWAEAQKPPRVLSQLWVPSTKLHRMEVKWKLPESHMQMLKVH